MSCLGGARVVPVWGWSWGVSEPAAELPAALVRVCTGSTRTPFSDSSQVLMDSIAGISVLPDVCLGKDFHSTNQGSPALVTKPWGPGLCWEYKLCKLLQTLFPCRVFVPKHAAGMRFQLSSCVTSQQRACSVRVLLGSITLPQSFQRSLTCTGSINCSLALDSPPWEKWLQIMVESLGSANASVSVEMLASFTGGIPFSLAVREGPEGALCVLCPS